MRLLALLLFTAPMVITPAIASAAAKGKWVYKVPGTAEAAGDITNEEAKRRAVEKAMAEAARRAYGESVRSAFLDTVIQAGDQVIEMGKRETRATAAGLVIDHTEPDCKGKDISPPGSKATVVQWTCQADFLVADLPETRPTFSVELKLDKAEVVSGTPVRLSLRSQERAHVYLFNLANDLRIYQLYPNQYRREVEVEKGRWLEFPLPDDPFDLVPRTLPGHKRNIEVLRVVATRRPTVGPVAAADQVISLRAFNDWLLGLDPGNWSDAEIQYTVYATRSKGD
jgi:hypothetical protein